VIVRAPELPPELDPVRRLPPAQPHDELDLTGARVEGEVPLRARRVTLRECELHEVCLEADLDRPRRGGGHHLQLLDVVLLGCDLSNVDAAGGQLVRVEITRSRLVGFSLSGGRARDLAITDATLQLASFASAGLESARFDRVDLREASFLNARLLNVEFVDCRMTGADFRGARLAGCAIRGASLDDIVGVDSLRGVRMPWGDIVSSAGAMAAALGIEVDE
jgi:uncharacterized protein YjbI with pentapeptide repeats